MVNIGGIFVPIPLTMTGVISLLVESLIIFIAIVLSDEFIEHELEAGHALMMTLIVYFIVPMLTSFISNFLSVSFMYLNYILPLVVWIILAEVFLYGDRMDKLKVAVLAFVIYTVLTIFQIPGIIMGLIPL
jgi:hypothetical protein